MTTPPASTPAGWYPDHSNPDLQRYWDGSQWTDQTAPKRVAATARASSKTKTVLIIAASVVGGLIVLGCIGNALGGNRDDGAPAANVADVPPPTPTATPTPSTTQEVAQPAAPVVDVEEFRADAHRDLDDLTKDLDDMVRTVDEGGFWRLLSNSVEVSFNYGQLSAHTPPPSVADAYAAGLQNLDSAITALTEIVTTDDTAAIRAAIENTRTQAAALRSVVDSAS